MRGIVNNRLEDWKKSATQVIKDWEKVGELFDLPLGISKAKSTKKILLGIKKELTRLRKYCKCNCHKAYTLMNKHSHECKIEERVTLEEMLGVFTGN